MSASHYSKNHAIGVTAVHLAKNPLGIIALFIVLVYGFASMITVFSQTLTASERSLMIYFLVLFPALVLGVFAWLVSCHAKSLYGPGDFRNEENYIRMQLAVVASLAAATARKPEGGSHDTDVNEIADTLRHAAPALMKRFAEEDASPPVSRKPSFSRTNYFSLRTDEAISWHNRILWVDDKPDRNMYERKAFQVLRLFCLPAQSTQEALEKLSHSKYAAIISDMRREEGPREGYVLLDALRKQGDQTPFFIYAGSDLPEDRKEAAEHGAQGCTGSPQTLFQMVVKAVMGH